MNLENQKCCYLNGWAHAQIHENTFRIKYNVQCYFFKNFYDVILLNNSGNVNAGFFNDGRGGLGNKKTSNDTRIFDYINSIMVVIIILYL